MGSLGTLAPALIALIDLSNSNPSNLGMSASTMRRTQFSTSYNWSSEHMASSTRRCRCWIRQVDRLAGVPGACGRVFVLILASFGRFQARNKCEIVCKNCWTTQK